MTQTGGIDTHTWYWQVSFMDLDNNGQVNVELSTSIVRIACANNKLMNITLRGNTSCRPTVNDSINTLIFSFECLQFLVNQV